MLPINFYFSGCFCGGVEGVACLSSLMLDKNLQSMRTQKCRIFATAYYKPIKNDSLGVSGQLCFMLKDNLCKEPATCLTLCRRLNDLKLPKCV